MPDLYHVTDVSARWLLGRQGQWCADLADPRIVAESEAKAEQICRNLAARFGVAGCQVVSAAAVVPARGW